MFSHANRKSRFSSTSARQVRFRFVVRRVSHARRGNNPRCGRSCTNVCQQIQPLLLKSCGKCHGRVPTDNDLDLTSFGSAQAILAKPKVLGDVAERLRLGDMPPKDAPQLGAGEREQLLGWINAALDAEAAARAGDPGR